MSRYGLSNCHGASSAAANLNPSNLAAVNEGLMEDALIDSGLHLSNDFCQLQHPNIQRWHSYIANKYKGPFAILHVLPELLFLLRHFDLFLFGVGNARSLSFGVVIFHMYLV